jgi:hypothetical protein
MKAEREKQWEQAIGSLIPVPLGHKAEDRRPINRDKEATDLLDSRDNREVEPLTQRLGSLFKEVGL